MEIRTIEEEVVVRGSKSGGGFNVRGRVRVIRKLGKNGRGKRVHMFEEIGMAVRAARIIRGWVKEEDAHVAFVAPKSVVTLRRSCDGGGHLV